MRIHDDKIAEFLDGCFKAGIKDPLRFLVDKMPRTYGWLKGAFPRGILPTDIDGFVEVGGAFLMIEFKHESALRDGRVPKGQTECFKRLTSSGPFTVFHVGHDERGKPTCLQIWSKGRVVLWEQEADWESVFKWCEKWSKKAETK